jgi:hypothetical protein
LFTGKTVVITFQNNTASPQTLTGLSMSWIQATNGKLQSIKMGGTTIYNTSTNNPLSTSSLLGTSPQRTIAAGSCAVLTFTFQSNVDTKNTDYTGTATFNMGAPTVMYLP